MLLVILEYKIALDKLLDYLFDSIRSSMNLLYLD